MGNISAIQFRSDQPAITDPGQRSVITDLVPNDMVPDVKDFFAELLELIMEPLNPWEPEWLLTQSLYEKHEDDPTKTTMTAYFDCEKLRKLIPGFTLEECCRIMVVTMRPEELFVKTEQYCNGGKKVFEVNTKFHVEEAGFRVEVWARDDTDIRRAGFILAKYADMLYLKPLLLSRSQKVRIRSGVDMPSSGGKSVVTDSLDGFTQEELYETLIRQIKREWLDFKGEIEYTSDAGDFRCDRRMEVPLALLLEALKVEDNRVAEKMDRTKMVALTASKTVLVDGERFHLVSTEYIMDELVKTRFFRVHADPVRIEVWQVLPNGERKANVREATELRTMMAKLCSEADVEQQVQDLDPSQENFYF